MTGPRDIAWARCVRTSTRVPWITGRELPVARGAKRLVLVSSGDPAGPGSRATTVQTDHETSPEASPPARAGLAPEQARGWLSLQSKLAWEPEKVGPLLREGRSPEQILCDVASLRAALELPFEPIGEGAERATADERLVRLGVRVVPLLDPAYPDALRALDDAPLVLSVRGDPAALSRPAIAIVGARAATRAARGFARRLAYDLARAGLTIVSGLARGIDAEAHRGALDAGGSTIAVLACGIDRIYPPEHRGLADEILRAGAIVSELPLGTLPRPLHFPLRNRIISGLSRAVVVVEARRRSGSLITVRHALAQGRDVFVVPGPVDGPFAAGTNQLLREGARAIQSARDLLDDLGIEIGPQPDSKPRSNRAAQSAEGPGGEGTLAERIAIRLGEGPRTPDELMMEAGLDAGRLASVLLELELAGRIAEERDGRLHLCRPPRDRDAVRSSLPCAPSQEDMLAQEATILGSIRDGEASARDRPEPG